MTLTATIKSTAPGNPGITGLDSDKSNFEVSLTSKSKAAAWTELDSTPTAKITEVTPVSGKAGEYKITYQVSQAGSYAVTVAVRDPNGNQPNTYIKITPSGSANINVEAGSCPYQIAAGKKLKPVNLFYSPDYGQSYPSSNNNEGRSFINALMDNIKADGCLTVGLYVNTPGNLSVGYSIITDQTTTKGILTRLYWDTANIPQLLGAIDPVPLDIEGLSVWEKAFSDMARNFTYLQQTGSYNNVFIMMGSGIPQDNGTSIAAAAQSCRSAKPLGIFVQEENPLFGGPVDLADPNQELGYKCFSENGYTDSKLKINKSNVQAVAKTVADLIYKAAGYKVS